MANRVLRVLVVACLVVSMALAAAPVGAASRSERAAGSSRGPRADALAEMAANRGPSKTSVTEAVTSVRDHRDLNAWMDSIAGVIKQRSGGEATVVTVSEDEEEPSYTGSYAEGAGAGDLDGDGVEDVAVLHYDLETDNILLEGRRGRDGTTLWEQTAAADADAALAWPVGEDLTGDGVADLVVYGLDILSEDVTEECEEIEDEEWCWVTAYEATYRWTVGLASGSTGEAIWTRTYDGEISEGYSDSEAAQPLPVMYEWTWDYTVKGTNVELLPFLGDLDADGRDELIVNALDIDYQETETDKGAGALVAGAGQYDYGHQLRAVTRIEVIGTDGTLIDSVTQPSQAAIALAYPLADRGGRTQLLLERAVDPDVRVSCVYADASVIYQEHCPTEEVGDPTFEVALLDGQTLDEVWSQSFDTVFGFTWPVGGDLDADGLDDIEVIVLNQVEDEDVYWYEFASTYVAASDGGSLWSSPDSFFAVGRLDDQPGDDLLSASWSYDYKETPAGGEIETETVTVQRRNGATGAGWGPQTWTTKSLYNPDGTEQFSWLSLEGADDLNGDETPDFTVNKISYSSVCDFETEECTDTPNGGWGEAISGLDSSRLYRAQSDKSIRVSPTADFDGDGGNELAVRTSEPVGEESRGTFTPVRVSDGTPLWTAEATGYFFYVAPTQDLDGDGGPDVLRHIDTLTGRRVQTSITTLNGRSGAAGWSLVSRP